MIAVVNNQKLWNLKKCFAEDVSAMMNFEVYGIGKKPCTSWTELYKKYLILDILNSYKSKCYNFCCDYGSFEYNEIFYFVLDGCSGEFEIGDSLTINTDSEDFANVDYVVSDKRVYPNINSGLYSAMLGAGFSASAMIVSFEDLVMTEVSTGTVSLTEGVPLTFDNRELTQEDIDCLIGNFC